MKIFKNAATATIGVLALAGPGGLRHYADCEIRDSE